MKNFRRFAAPLFASALVSLAAQTGEDLSALRAKAEKGNGLAQYNLGLAYAEGKGVAADRVEAYVWLSLARENGARGRALDTLVGVRPGRTGGRLKCAPAKYSVCAAECVPRNYF